MSLLFDVSVYSMYGGERTSSHVDSVDGGYVWKGRDERREESLMSEID